MVMDEKKLKEFNDVNLPPYIGVATMAIFLPRKTAGNVYRHQMATMSILVDYGHIDSVLLKASVVHDMIEDIKNFNESLIINCDHEGPQVHKLVLEVTKRDRESKADFLRRIYEEGSDKACLIKAADRISNLSDRDISMGKDFIKRLCDDTEEFVIPIAKRVCKEMVTEMKDLVKKAREMLAFKVFLEEISHNVSKYSS
jgi:GTP pyrophosphokinase